jgi:hypothetical protein
MAPSAIVPDGQPDHVRPALARRHLDDLRVELHALGQLEPPQKFQKLRRDAAR